MKKYLLILLIPFLAFTFTGNPPSGWYQQFLPDLGGGNIIDLTFTNSLRGYAITPYVAQNDSAFVLKTTNGGDNWSKIKTISGEFVGFSRIKFINESTGFLLGVGLLEKTTNEGLNWQPLGIPKSLNFDDFYVLNQDTIWVSDNNSLTGGVFRTINGGVNWTHQINLGSQNPTNIYFYNKDIGFISKNTASPYTRKTTNGGNTWNIVTNNGFTDMYFIDSLKGWKCGNAIDSIQATTDGGNTWFKQTFFHTGGFFSQNAITDFAFVGEDTIWGVGARANTSQGTRGLIYRSTNAGETWGYQLPDPGSINIFQYQHIIFSDGLNGWAYTGNKGVHTVTGGDTTIYLGVHQISNEVPSDYILHQNYPNPFNPVTTIRYEVLKSAKIKIKVFDITGQEIINLVNQKQQIGIYEVDFPGSLFPSGIYFYSLIVENNISDTKKMILVK